MELEMVLNELSLKSPVSDISTARKLMSELIGTLSKAKVSGIKVLRTSDKIDYLQLTNNYPISRWRNDSKVDREERRFFKTLVTKAPFWNDIVEDLKEEFNLSEIRYQGELASGIGFALIIDALPISFNSEAQWNSSYLNLEVIRIDVDEEIVDETVRIPHASCSDHVKEHTDWIN